MFSYGGHEYRVRHLADFIGAERDNTSDQKTLNAILVRLGEGLGARTNAASRWWSTRCSATAKWCPRRWVRRSVRSAACRAPPSWPTGMWF